MAERVKTRKNIFLFLFRFLTKETKETKKTKEKLKKFSSVYISDANNEWNKRSLKIEL